MHNIPHGVPPDTPPDNLENALRSDIEQRLRKACADWTEEEFRRLVDDATAIAMKYVSPETRPGE
jgi:hypothetical protein